MVAIAIAAWFTFHSREPEYQGKRLSAWLEDLSHEPKPEEMGDEERGSAAFQARIAKVTEAVRAIGTNALPFLLEWSRTSPTKSPLRDKIQDLLDKQSLLNIQLPERKDQLGLAFEGLFALGPAAAPAIPELGRLLERDETSWQASICLHAIGPMAIPTLVRCLTNGTPRTRSRALLTLGDFGSDARQLTPLILSFTQSTNRFLADPALRVVSEVSERPADFIPLFAAHLGNTNTARGAAFALARIGPPGLPVLLEALTNEQREIKSAVIAALRPRILEPDIGWATNLPGDRFSSASGSFDSKCNQGMIGSNPRRETLAVVSALTKILDCNNADIRLSVVKHLEPYGADAAPGLCKALEDSSESVRQLAAAEISRLPVELRHGGIIRGPTREKKIALVFTGHEFAEGGEVILNDLAQHEARASFFVTGDFAANPKSSSLLGRMIQDGHYVGPNSGKYLFYRSWEDRNKTPLSRNDFYQDISYILNGIPDYGQTVFRKNSPGYFLPAYEHYNHEIALWSLEMLLTLINFTPGTLSNTDYTSEADPGFVSSQAIFDSIVRREREDPHGLNGFILLLHLGSGPGRADKFHTRFGELLDTLAAKGYQFVRVDELLDPKAADAK